LPKKLFLVLKLESKLQNSWCLFAKVGFKNKISFESKSCWNLKLYPTNSTLYSKRDQPKNTQAGSLVGKWCLARCIKIVI